MYREFVKLLLTCTLIIAAPQQNSNITYIKKQIESIDEPPQTKNSYRESRIEILPLTIPGNFKLNEPANINDTERIAIKRPEKPDQPLYIYSDRIYSIKNKTIQNNSTETNNTDNSTEGTVLPEKPVEGPTNDTVSDILSAESINTHVLTNNDISTVKYETDSTIKDDLISTKYEDEPTVIAKVVEETTKAPKSLPKWSHYRKSQSESFSQNLIKNSGKRRFRSRCRCEKIWNCAKLQITVPRCPDEYFLCCA